MSGSLKMTVNVSLCGSIPRSQMNLCTTKQLRELDMNNLDSHSDLRNGCKTPCQKSSALRSNININVCLPRQVSCEEMNAIAPSPPPIIEPPSWAVAAEGDARLEPVCESFKLQVPIDLTKKAVYRIGRSQNSDIQLLHCTSSRRHAILFHHPNGSCYIVDCGSAHGTYVNGVRVNTVMHSNHNNGSSGIILPHKVKKGSLIRFGGQGAPCFILKSFSVGLETLVKNLKETSQTAVCQGQDDLNSKPETCRVENNGSEMSSEALVTLNTRLNAIGSTFNSLSPKYPSSLSSAHIHARLQPQTQTSNISFLKKRSIVSFDDGEFEADMPPMKKLKPRFPVQSASAFDQFPTSDIAIVSPSRQQKVTLHFDFESIDRPVVSPTPVEEEMQLNICNGLSEGNVKSILRTPLSLPSAKRRNRRVNFSDTPPKVFHPLTVSTDESE